MDEALEVLTLRELLRGTQAYATPGVGGASARRSGGAASAPKTTPTQLHSALLKELSAVEAMFNRWQEDVEAKQRAAAAARPFSDDHSLSLALLVLNKRGERRRGARVAQEWYFVPRQAPSSSSQSGSGSALPCSRCCLSIRRREVYYVDRAARRQADELCGRCMVCVMRSLLGQDDAGILAEAQAILESCWHPTINAAFVEALPGRPSLLEDL